MELTLEQALQKGITAHQTGNFQQAELYYSAILKSSPSHPDANHNMGVIAVGIGKLDAAIPFFKTAIGANQKVAQYWLSYISTLIKLNRMDEARIAFDQAKNLGAKGEGFDQLEQNLGSLTYKSSDHHYPPADQLQLLIKLYNQGKIQRALDKSNSLLARFPNSAVLLNIHGIILKSLRQFDLSISALKKALEIKPDFAEAFNNLGSVFKEQGKLQDAIKAYNNALDIKPDFAEAYNNIGNALKEQGNTPGAIEAYKKALVIKPKYAAAFYNMGTAFQEHGDLAEALESYKKALEIKPKYPEVYHNKGILFQNKGKLEEALEAYKKALMIKPDYAEAWNNMGGSLQEHGKPEDAIDAYKKALAIKPDYAEAFRNMGNVLKDQGKPEDAINMYKKALEIKPEYAAAWYNLGSVMQEQGRLTEAMESYNQALTIKPKYAEAWNNIGNTLKEQEKLEDAIEAYRKALTIKPNYAAAFNNMGNALKDQGKLQDAIEAYMEALDINPSFSAACYNMGIALREKGKLDEALEAYEKALMIKPDYAEAWNNMGIALQEQDKLDEALEAYKKALAIKPDCVDIWSNGAEALETWNKLDDLEMWLRNAYDAFEVVPSDLYFMKSKLLWRNNKYQEAVRILEDINIDLISDFRKQDYLQFKAKCFDKIGRYEEAYSYFEKSNALAKKSKDYLRCGSEQYFQNLKYKLSKLELISTTIHKDEDIEDSNFKPVFLVGFPRSGTTLLDTILRSNSKISVVEEQGMLSITESFLKQNGINDFTQEAIKPKLKSEAQKIYRNEFNKHIDTTIFDQVFIDKLPLNLLEAPLINQLYPRARFILAIRHPMDSILSCWMQNFKINAPMANMFDLDRIVEFYCVAMEMFKKCKNHYDLNVHEIRYEDLINNFQSEVEDVLKFLGVQWEPTMENYQDTALNRGRINTPSYSQVVQPIYKDAEYRWVNYRSYIDQYLPQVEPWISEFRYV